MLLCAKIPSILMENESRLKLIVAGLVLAAFAVGYFILAQRFQGGSSRTSPRPTTPANIVIVSPSPTASASPTIVGQAGGGTDVSTLPRTGFPLPIAVSLASAAIVSGWFLRKYPN